jgi:hydrogenase maturation protein HypF
LEFWDARGALVADAAEDRPGVGAAFGSIPESLRPEGCAPALVERSALRAAAEAIRAGRIVGIKGLGGFHLVVAAQDDLAVAKLRERKHRTEKPFAVMFPSLGAVEDVCEVSLLEERLLRSPEAPIVLLRRLAPVKSSELSPLVAQGNPNLGAMLPYTPLHHLLLASLQFPVVATSGNLSDEPICTDEREAIARLAGIADFFLVHNRPIVRHVDDSVVRVMVGRELVLRRARGYAPLPVAMRSAEARAPNVTGTGELGPGAARDMLDINSALRTPHSTLGPVLAVGAHLKNAIALGVGPQVFISQHIGDLETAQAYEAFQRVTTDFQRLYDSPAVLIVTDAHPAYLSTQFAHATGLPCLSVQHHVAHVLSCMAENELEPPVLGVSWDGTGYGVDGTVWGGEFFQIKNDGYQRVAHFRQFRLPGGERAVREPRRSALGLLFDIFGEAAFDRSDLRTADAFSSHEKAALRRMLGRKFNSPLTSSVGRLFDGVASLVGLRQRVRFEGQAAMDLEFLLEARADSAAYELPLEETPLAAVLDWRPSVAAILADLSAGVALSTISARFHNLLVESVLKVARRTGLERVALSGGCFQNRYLTEHTVRRLAEEGFRPYWHQRVPPNDGGICLGQVVAARWWKV